MSGTFGWAILAVVAPVTVVLGYRQFTPPPLPEQASRSPGQGGMPAAKDATPPAVTPQTQPPVAGQPPQPSALEDALRNPIVATRPADCLRGVTSVQVDIFLNDTSRSALNLDSAPLKAKVEGRLRQARIPVQEPSLTTVRLAAESLWVTKDTTVCTVF